MTEQQRKAIEILNKLHAPMVLSEEKAKAYDEAKCIMEKYLKSGNAGVIAENTIKNAFPELKESEDEKTRKSLISYLHGLGEFEYPNKKTYNNWLVWLEKQGEQILANSAKTCKNEQKPTWSEEDEEHVNSLLQRLEGLCRKEFATTRFAINEDEDWLKSLKERVQPQSKSALEINNEVLLHVPAIEDTNKVLRDMICEYFGDGRPMDEDEINAFKKWLLSKVKKQ